MFAPLIPARILGVFFLTAQSRNIMRKLPLNDILFPYQKETILQAYTALKTNRAALVVLDTGGGKTFIFSSIAKDGQDHGRRVLILTDRLLLSKQTLESLERAGCDVGIINDGEYTKPVSIATIQTAARRLDKIQAPDLLIIDEAHEGIFKKAFSYWPDCKILGFTGTPVSNSKRDPLNNYYDVASCAISRTGLLELGRLVPIKSYETVLDLSNLRKVNGEYSEASQYSVFGTPECFEAFRKQLDKSERKKTVVFCSSVKLTEETAGHLNSWGYEAWYITGSTKQAERDEIIRKLNESKYGILVNCMVATKGFDCPTLERAVFFYATTSLSKYYQTGGRVCRCAPGKEYADIWDYGGNVKRFWDLNSDVDWVDMFENPPKPGDGVAPVKNCKSCDAIINASAKVCTVCKAEQPKSPKEIAEARALELKEAQAKNALVKRLEKGTPKRDAQTFAALAEKQGLGSVKNVVAFLRKETSRRKSAYWIFASAKGAYQYGGEQAVKELWGNLSPGFYNDVLKAAKEE